MVAYTETLVTHGLGMMRCIFLIVMILLADHSCSLSEGLITSVSYVVHISMIKGFIVSGAKAMY